MSGPTRRWAGVVLGTAAVFGLAAASRLPYPAADAEQAVLRLSWRSQGARLEECRRLSPEELAELPVHMRRAEVCEGRLLPHELVVELDGVRVVRETILPAGARGDRPLYVHREMALAPGARRLSVRFAREGAGAADAPGGPPGEHAAAPPARLELDRPVELRAGEVLLVTYDPDQRRLVVRQPEPRR